jgi:hypothetical protein
VLPFICHLFDSISEEECSFGLTKERSKRDSYLNKSFYASYRHIGIRLPHHCVKEKVPEACDARDGLTPYARKN